ncbi:MAG: patatin-like phospholipase family protein [Acidobacteriota bacterium]|nr:patatin-like phospholipase family protein [Acidobacteriota bacterium]
MHILAMDGGGIYGLATALMLDQIIGSDTNAGREFLNGDDVDLFSGTSAGAINALLLAQEETPRDYVSSGKLARFWCEAGSYANDRCPWAALTSLWGITAWGGAADFQQLLNATFGEKTLKDLKHPVLICTYDWYGRKGHWAPAFFSNGYRDHLYLRLADLAYYAASPPGFHPIRDGYGDAGIFAPDPCLNAILSMNAYLKKIGINPLPLIGALSIGVANSQPKYWLKDFDLGNLPFYYWLPTNPGIGDWWPPIIQILLNAPTDNTNLECAELLAGYHRLNPPVLGPPNMLPTLIATAWARFAIWRDWLVTEITKRMAGGEVTAAVNETIQFLQNGWKKP